MDNIVKGVYDLLGEKTGEIGKVIAEVNTVEEKIKSDRYTPQVVSGELYPERDRLKRKVRSMSDAALRDAKNLVEQYRQDVEKSNSLNPDDLTDDVKLLQSGIVLNASDIKWMIERNQGNRTMLQIILRYAAEHGIDTGTIYSGGEDEMQTADNLDSIIHYYSRWIDTPNARAMLDKFFDAATD